MTEKSRSKESAPLFVRIPIEHARRLDRAATAAPARKKDLIAGLVERYVDPETPDGLAALRELAEDVATPRRVVIEDTDGGLTVGHHSFRPAAAPEVLTPKQAGELLAIDEQDVVELADSGELPGRKLAGHWRFSRQALLDWLANAD